MCSRGASLVLALCLWYVRGGSPASRLNNWETDLPTPAFQDPQPSRTLSLPECSASGGTKRRLTSGCRFRSTPCRAAKRVAAWLDLLSASRRSASSASSSPCRRTIWSCKLCRGSGGGGEGHTCARTAASQQREQSCGSSHHNTGTHHRQLPHRTPPLQSFSSPQHCCGSL